ncbi:hypothetical protein ABMA32_07435 [Mesorhizobium sp. VNQ89]|uniref:hypothetical protein n=1 Tax=Mesorhizobium quangtriensis TaxID=3157709 RepID=UPI0032B7043A
MHRLREEIAAFIAAKDTRAADARQLAAVQIACHIDLSGVLEADAATRARMVLHLKRKIERERLRGASGHWSYDINRHIALKQALETLMASEYAGKYFVRKKKSRQYQPSRNKKTASPDAAFRFNNKTTGWPSA